jgi:hypothetical protein
MHNGCPRGSGMEKAGCGLKMEQQHGWDEAHGVTTYGNGRDWARNNM